MKTIIQIMFSHRNLFIGTSLQRTMTYNVRREKIITSCKLWEEVTNLSGAN